MDDGPLVSLLSQVPRGLATWMGRIGRTPSRWLARAFVYAYGVELGDAERSSYPSLDAVFTRRLRPGARPIDLAPVISPVDGRVAWCGPTDGVLPLGPVPFAIADVVRAEVVVRSAVVLYLSPRDYHRVHAPFGGRLSGYRYVPGRRFPVFGAAVRRIPHLFARNERLVFQFDTPQGPAVIVLIGAFGVGRIRSPHLEVPDRASEGPLEAEVVAGEEIGVFHLGSTVLLGLPVAAPWCVSVGQTVRMGRALARSPGPEGPAALRCRPA